MIKKILKILEATYPNAKIALNYGDTFQLLVAVILSAQCTDERVNKVTPALFERFPTVKDFAECDIQELEQLIFSTGFYRAKAKNIRAAARVLLERFGGEVPKTMKDLLQIPGAARKTANVVLSTAYNLQEGIVVDTHVARIAGRLGLVSKADADGKKAVKIERELTKVIPKKYWGVFPHWLILHGRQICIARKPLCKKCPLVELCPSREIK